MIIKELVDELENNGFIIDNFRNEQIYNKILNDEVSIAAYARISSEDGKDVSIQRQYQSVANFFNSFNYNINNISFYDDIQSGTNLERPNYKRLINDCKVDNINVVVTASFNRMGRDSDVLLDVLYKNFYNRNIIFIALREKIINSLSYKFKFKELALEAEKYCKDTSKIVRQALKQKAIGGSFIGSRAPFGYTIEEIIETEPFLSRKHILLKASDGSSEIVKQIFFMYLDAKGYDYIANYLNNQELKSPNLSKWCGNTVKSILTNPLYAGILAQGRYCKKGYKNNGDDKKILKVQKNSWIYGEDFEGIVSKEVFNSVQNEMLRRNSLRRKGEKTNLFTGLLKCGDCGHALIYKKRDQGYKCSKSQEKGGECTTHFIKEEELLNAIIEQFPILIGNDEIELLKNKICEEWQSILGIKDVKVSINYIDKQIKTINKKIDQAYKRSEDGTLSIENFVRLERNYLDQVHKNEKQKEILLKAKQNSYILKDKAEEIIDDLIGFKDINNTTLRNLIKEIKVYNDGTIEIVWNFSLKSKC